MKLLQLYYTSCQRGRSPGSGFQVYSASEGLTEEEILEIERYGVYIPPTHLPGHPTEEEIKTKFPVAFSFFQLKNGRYGICQSVYIGKDYSGRYGNYFSHALILEEGEWPFDPILLYKSPDLRTSLTLTEQEISYAPSPLPPLSSIKLGAEITEEKVNELISNERNKDVLTGMLNALIEEKGAPGSLFITAEQNEIPLWVAAVRLALPFQLTHQLFFTTYSYDPERENFVINATLDEGVRFNFQDRGLYSQLNMFNMKEDSVSRINSHFSYPDQMAGKLKLIKKFEVFLKDYNYSQLNGDLDKALKLFALQHSPTVLLSEKDWLDMISYARRYLRQEAFSNFMEKVPVDQLSDIPSRSDLEAVKEIVLFLFETANITKLEAHHEKATEFLIEALDVKMTEARDVTTIKTIEQFFEEVYQVIVERRYFYNLFLSPERLDLLREQLQQMNNREKERFYHQKVIQFISETNKSWGDLYKSQKDFIVQYLPGELQYSQFCSGSFFAQMVVYWGKRVTNHSSFNLVKKEFDTATRPSMWEDKVCRTLEKEKEGRELLLNLFSKEIEATTEKTDYLIQYLARIGELSQFWREHSKNILSKYKEEVLIGKPFDELLKLFKNEGLVHLLEQNGILKSLMKNSELILPFNKGLQEKREQLVTLNNKYLELIGKDHKKLVLAIETIDLKQKKKYDTDYLKSFIPAAMKELEKWEYKDYLLWALPDLMPAFYQDKKVFSDLVKKIDRVEFTPTIIESLQKLKETQKLKHSPNFFAEYFYLLNDREADEYSRSAKEEMKKYLIENPNEAKKIDELFKNVKGDLPVKKKWQSFYKEAQKERGNAFMRSVKKLMGR
ncbi:GAP1-N2 domain-containing protein [Alkalihalobacterium chitinilyticum]|uniref:Uncharacterized protein n=1 Tax=Alkalihalobacterium chitinilyticum TaxID=2980103 RepID=A0ABT5VFK4_9BACI|nr:hypothetical protein [Alkalihalobacterium chitinilyticum]MDE5414060.1 hypothetical protein [Alkalihalobacterium chitinilyticum]